MKFLKNSIALVMVMIIVFGLALPAVLAMEDASGEYAAAASETDLESDPDPTTEEDTGQEESSDWDWSIQPSLTDPEDHETDAETDQEAEINISYAAAEDLTEDPEAETQSEDGEPSFDDVIETPIESGVDGDYYLAETITFDADMNIVSDETYDKPGAEDDIMLLSMDGGFESDTEVTPSIRTSGESAKSEISSTFQLYGSASTGWYSWNGDGWTYVTHDTGVPERVHWLNASNGYTYVAYCIQPWKNSATTSSYVYTSSAVAITNTLSDAKKQMLALAMVYGYSNYCTSSGSYVYTGLYNTNIWAFYGTQMIIWEILCGVRDTTSGISYFNRIAAGTDPDYCVFAAFYNKTVSSQDGYFGSWSGYRFIAENIHFHGQLPTWVFDTDEEAEKNPIKLTYNESTGKYVAVAHNTNEVLNDNYYHPEWGYSSYLYYGVDYSSLGSYWLSRFEYHTDYDDRITFESDNSGNITITADPSVIEELRSAGVNTIPVRVITPSAKTDNMQVKVWNVYDSSLQQMITLSSDGESYSWAEASMMLTFDSPTEQKTGSLSITKTGRLDYSTVDESTGLIEFDAKSTPLSGTVFQVVNTSPLLDEDGNVLYEAGKYSITVTTDEDGKAEALNIPIGEYEVTEIQVQIPYLLNGMPETIIIMADETTELSFVDNMQTAEVTVIKLDDGTEEPLSGAGFALYAAEDVTYAGETIYAAGRKIESVTTGADGTASFVTNVPVGFSYYIIEETPPAGYEISDDGRMDFTAEFDADVEMLELSYEFRDTPKTADLSLTKKLACENTEPARQFVFTVTLTPPEGSEEESFSSTCSASYTLKNETTNGTIIFTDNVSSEIRICADQTVTISGLPVGWGYSVEEDESASPGYSVYEWENQTGTTGTGESAAVICTNTRGVWEKSDIEFPDTGSNDLEETVTTGIVLAVLTVVVIGMYAWLSKMEANEDA